jgi:hypothetical protein
VRNVAGDVDVGALNVEGAPVDAVAVGIGDIRVRLNREGREQASPHPIDGVSSGGV